jgi:hypothetical protein
VLRQRIGIGAGVLLFIVIAFAATPPLIVQNRLHAFIGRLHAGMTREQINDAARASQLAPSTQNGPTMDFDDPPPWSIATSCRDDYAVVIVMSAGRAKSWAKIKNRICS